MRSEHLQVTKKPELQDFGIEPEEYALYKDDAVGYLPLGRDSDGWAILEAIFSFFGNDPDSVFERTLPVIFVIVFSVFGIITRDVGLAVFFGILLSLFPGLFVAAHAAEFFRRFERSRLLTSTMASRVRSYEESQAAYRAFQCEQEAERESREAERARREAVARARRRKLIDHWLSLSGRELEREMAVLCKHLGYRVESTPVSGDGGVDLILKNKSGEKVVVQCKSYKSPVGPAAARELYGSMMDFGAPKAVLVCPAGFTRGVEEFVNGKPIDLVAAEDLIRLAACSEATKRGGKIGT